MSSSVGIVTPNIWKKKLFQTTNQEVICSWKTLLSWIFGSYYNHLTKNMKWWKKSRESKQNPVEMDSQSHVITAGMVTHCISLQITSCPSWCTSEHHRYQNSSLTRNSPEGSRESPFAPSIQMRIGSIQIWVITCYSKCLYPFFLKSWDSMLSRAHLYTYGILQTLMRTN